MTSDEYTHTCVCLLYTMWIQIKVAIPEAYLAYSHVVDSWILPAVSEYLYGNNVHVYINIYSTTYSSRHPLVSFKTYL